MTAVVVLFALGAYAVLSYGYVLIRGWDITFKQWVDPLNPYQWPASGDPPTVPTGQVFP